MYTEAWEAEWERVLWKKKPYPDNYVPRSFLASLSRNREYAACGVLPLESREFESLLVSLPGLQYVQLLPSEFRRMRQYF